MKQSNNGSRACPIFSSRALAVALGFWTILLPMRTRAAENTNQMVKPPVGLPGGLSLHPVITSVTRTQDVVTVEWFGLQGPFQVLHSTSANTNDWQKLGNPTFRSRLNVSLPGELGFFRVLGG